MPENFQLFFKIDDGASNYSPITEDYKVGEYIDKVTGKRTNIDLISKTYAIVFHKPIFAKRIKLILKKPFFADYFAIEKVRFFQRRSYVLVKNEMLDYCNNFCFFINTNVPRDNFNIEAYPCIEIVNLSDNRELFINYNDRSIRLAYDQSKCVGFNGAKELVIKTCSDYQTTYEIDFKTDNTLFFEGYQQECIYIDGSKNYSDNFVNQDTEINVTSEGDLQTYKKENIKIVGSNFWSSTPGEKKVTIQALFGRFKNENGVFDFETKKVDVIKIEWNHFPKRFKLYTWTKGGIWILIKEFSNYSQKETDINLNGQQMSAIMIVMDEGHKHKEIGNRIAYSIQYIYVGTKSYKLKTGECKNIDDKYKIFDFDNQSYRNIDQTKEYIKNKIKLNNTFTTLRQKYLILLKEKMTIKQAEIKGINMREILLKTLISLKTKVLERIKEFQYTSLSSIKNTEFSGILNRRKWRPMLFPDEVLSLKIGTYEFPAPDCLAIKKSKKSVISGFYYIKTDCSPKPIRVYCDFSILQDAIDIMVFNDENDVPNPDISYLKINSVDHIRYFCAKQGLFPIKLQNKFTVQRIEEVLTMMNYNINMAQAFPLGYDYQCDQNNCSGLYGSIDDRSSNPINSYFNTNNNQASKMEGKGKFAGLGFSKNRELITYDLKQKIRIGALICSTNHYKTDLSDGLETRLSCSDPVSLFGSLFPINSDVIILCPMDCDKFPGQVYGDGMYHANSSVCKAAMHSGVLSKTGGKIHVKVSSPQSTYKQSSKNAISSLEYNINDGLPSFFTEKFVPDCPIDNLKNKFPPENEEKLDQFSFIQKSEEVELRDNYYSFMENGESQFPSLNKLADQSKKAATDAMNNGLNSVNDLARNAANQANSIKGKVNEYLDNNNVNALADNAAQTVKSLNPVRDELKQINNINNPSNPDSPFNPINVEKIKKQMIKEESSHCEPNTDSGKKILRTRREELDWDYFNKMKKKVDVIKLAHTEFNKEMSWSQRASMISNEKIKILFAFLQRFRSKLLKLIRRIYSRARGRIFRTQGINRLLEDEYYRLCNRDDYILNYNNNEEIFTRELLKFDFADPKKIKSNVY